jgi:hypothetical protein
MRVVTVTMKVRTEGIMYINQLEPQWLRGMVVGELEDLGILTPFLIFIFSLPFILL